MTVDHYIYNLKQGLNSPLRILLFLGSIFVAVYLGSIPLRSNVFDAYLSNNIYLDFIFLLLPFVCGFIAISLFIKPSHNLRLRDLIIPIRFQSIDYKRLLFSFGTWFFLMIVFELIMYFIDPGNYRFISLKKEYVLFVLISILLIPIQTSFEELLIRSYLTQQLHVYTGKIFFSILLGSVVFACMHLNNPEVISFGLPIMFAYYFIAGLFLALLAYKDGRMEISLGVHAANNIFSALVVNYAGSVFKTQTIAETIKMNVPLSLVAFCVSAILFYLICSYKYKWGIDFGINKNVNQSI